MGRVGGRSEIGMERGGREWVCGRKREWGRGGWRKERKIEIGSGRGEGDREVYG